MPAESVIERLRRKERDQYPYEYFAVSVYDLRLLLAVAEAVETWARGDGARDEDILALFNAYRALRAGGSHD